MGFFQEALDDGALTLFPFLKPCLIAASCPPLDVLVDEAWIAELFEVGADFSVGDAVVEPLVDLNAEVVWEFGDFASETAGRFYMSQRRERRRRRASRGRRINGVLDCRTIGWVDG